MSITSEKEDPNTTAVVSAPEPVLYGGGSTIPIWRMWTLLAGLLLLFMCNSGSIQSMNVAVGFVAQDLGFENSMVTWIQSAYQLSSGCLLLLFVPLCDVVGARWIAIGAGVFYTIWSAACANAQTVNQFIIFRALQGVGACAGVPAAYAILGQILPVVEGSGLRPLIISIYSAGAPLGSGIGTVIGGLATQYSAIQWRGIYASFSGIGGFATILVIASCPPSQLRHVVGGVDWIGTAMITVSLTFIIFCMSQGPSAPLLWNTAYIIALFVIGCLMFVAFIAYEIWIERIGKTPMLRMSNFLRGRYLAINVLGLFGFGGFVTWDFFAGLYYAQVQGQDAVNIMLRFLPQTLGAFVSAWAATMLLRRISTQYVFLAGCLSALLGALIFAVSDVSKTYWSSGEFIGFYLSIQGACFVFASGMLYSVSVVVPAEQPAAGGLFQVMTSLASAFCPTIGNIIANAHVSATDPAQSFHYGFYTAVAFAAFAFVAAVPGLWGIGIINKTGETKRVEHLVAEHHEDALFEKKRETEEVQA